ncbi:hypothetical protein D3C81_1013290 [compost metagenome]
MVSGRLSGVKPNSMRLASICKRPVPVPGPLATTAPGAFVAPCHTRVSVWMRASASVPP